MTGIFQQIDASRRQAFIRKWREEMRNLLFTNSDRTADELPVARLDRLAVEYASTPCAPLSSLGVRKAEADEAGMGF